IVKISNSSTITPIREPFQFIERGVVEDIIADKNGNIWCLFSSVKYSGRIYKQSALMKYDGSTWLNLNIDSININENAIYSIALDNENNLYCGGLGELAKYDGNNWSHYVLPGNSSRKKILSLAFGPTDSLWVGGSGFSLLYRFYKGNWYSFNEQYAGYDVTSIVFDQKDNVWISSRSNEKGLAKRMDYGWQYFNKENSALLWPNVNFLAIDSTGMLWCGTPFGACTFNGENWEYYAASSGIPHYTINKVIEDENITKWIATEFFGLVKFDGTNWNIYNKSNSEIPSNQINDIALDSKMNVWISTRQGLCMYDGKFWQVYNQANTGHEIDYAWDIEIDSKDKIWISIFDQNMLASFDGNEWKIYNSQNTILPDNFIGRLAVDPDDNLWVGTNDGFFIYNGTEWKHFTADNSDLPDNWVQCFAFDSIGASWIGTANGVTKIKDDVWEVYTNKNSAMIGWDVNDITIDAQNNVWLGFFWRQGIAKYDGLTWQNYNYEFMPNTGGFNGMSIDLDRHGNLWIGTLYSGLLQFNDNKILSTQIDNGISQMKQNSKMFVYPNPFNSQTKITFTLAENSNISLKLFSITGEFIRNVAKGIYQKGKNTVAFEASDLPTGVYICILETAPFSKLQKQFTTQKILLLK
ncbi:MAG: T9SS type A sorting domain-containing protein, partial [Melioribacteraceae bacterium]|nr:T9SS type A sorting domain-containing protein [Melioribacteraceae bacterium]